MRLEVLTLNLWGRRGPVEERTARLLAVLDADPVDVLALQEVERHGGATQADAVADAAGFAHRHVSRAGLPRLVGEGLAIVSTIPLEPLADVPLPRAHRDPPRLLQRADARLPDGRVLRLANTHLAYRVADTAGRVRQAEAAAAALRGGGPAILLGDLNDVPGSPPLEVLAAAGFEDAFARLGTEPGWTFARANPWTVEELGPDRRIDHVLVTGEVAVVGGTVVDEPLLSDHYAVRVSVEV